MAAAGLLFEKDNPISAKIISLFEKVRVAYLSAKSDAREYGSRWRKAVEDIRSEYDDLDALGRQLQNFIPAKDLESKDAMNIESTTAKVVYDGIKALRFESEEVQDPFAKHFKGKVLEALLDSSDTMVKFLHYAIRSDSEVLSPEMYAIKDMEEDTITDGLKGMDLSLEDVPLYIIEHYGDGKDSKKVETKVKSATAILKLIYASKFSETDWNDLVGIDLQKADASVDFLIPNKPMYRIFDLEDLEELKGFSGEYVVQEKYDGMRIQIHKIDGKVSIYSYNEKDITNKCPEQVKVMQAKHFGDCILDAELILFDGDTSLHRADTVSHVFKNQYPDAILRAHVFDIMRHEERNLAEEPLRDRINTLFHNYTMHSDEKLAFPSKKDTRIADNIKDIGNYAKEIMEMPTAEGVVIKDIESTYFIGTKKNPKWVKWKKFVDLDLIVLEKKTTKSDMYSYALGAGPVEGEGKHIEELNGQKYLNVGRANNTKLEVEVGEILRVKVDEVKESEDRFTLYGAKAIEVPEVTAPEKIITLELLAGDTKPSLKYKAKALEKGILITDHIHGEAILKSMDGFTLYEFETDNLMSKNAMANLDLWKEQAEEIMKTKQSTLTNSVFHYLKENGPKSVKEVHNYLLRDYPHYYEQVLDSKLSKVKDWFESREGILYDERTNKLYSEADKIMMESMEPDYRTPEEYRQGQFKVYLRKDEDLTLAIKLQDTSLYWNIDINSDDDVFNLFGKAAKFPAEVATNVSKDRVIDEGDIELGVQRHGYHEYFLKGNKFETKMHFRLIPVDNKQMWLAWTGYKQDPASTEGDEGIWNITKDKHKDIGIPPK